MDVEGSYPAQDSAQLTACGCQFLESVGGRFAVRCVLLTVAMAVFLEVQRRLETGLSLASIFRVGAERTGAG